MKVLVEVNKKGNRHDIDDAYGQVEPLAAEQNEGLSESVEAS
jgi:hypothetical protein